VCDYCDCRSHPEIAELFDDHVGLLCVLGDLRRALTDDDHDAGSASIAALHERLHRHAGREERGVFAELRTQVGDDYIAMFEHDHAALHGLLEAEGDWRGTAERLIAQLADHILREESDLFPAAHQLLTPAQWDRIELDAHAPTS
jgi:hemerythrin-like domain-containing protein